jgi:hypothetical protein
VSSEAEVKLFKRLLGVGVVISQGSSFGTEELGWYRISFAVEEQALNVGLQRLGACLDSIKNDGWWKWKMQESMKYDCGDIAESWTVSKLSFFTRRVQIVR